MRGDQGGVQVAQRQKSSAKGSNLTAWLKWDLATAQQSGVPKLGYAPLPSKLDQLALAAVNSVH